MSSRSHQCADQIIASLDLPPLDFPRQVFAQLRHRRRSPLIRDPARCRLDATASDQRRKRRDAAGHAQHLCGNHHLGKLIGERVIASNRPPAAARLEQPPSDLDDLLRQQRYPPWVKLRATIRRSLVCTGGLENGIVSAPPNGSGPRENMEWLASRSRMLLLRVTASTSA